MVRLPPTEVLLWVRIVLAILGFDFPYEAENCPSKICQLSFHMGARIQTQALTLLSVHTHGVISLAPV